jgi:hypothetical protein
VFHIVQTRAKCIKDSKDCVCARPGKGPKEEKWRKGMQERTDTQSPFVKAETHSSLFPVANPQTGLFTTSIYSTFILSTVPTTFTTTSIPDIELTLFISSYTTHQDSIILSSSHPFHPSRYPHRTLYLSHQPLESYHCETKLLVID